MKAQIGLKSLTLAMSDDPSREQHCQISKFNLDCQRIWSIFPALKLAQGPPSLLSGNRRSRQSHPARVIDNR